MQSQPYNKIFFDFDSTIIAGESLDWLADIRGIGSEVRKMTKASMDGITPLEQILDKKMSIILPSKSEIDIVVKKAKGHLVEGIQELMLILKKMDKEVFVLSSNFHCIVDPIMADLDVDQNHILANRILFDCEVYKGIGRNSKLTTSRGKVDVIKKYCDQNNRVVMIGDSASDMMCKKNVDLFIGFGGVESRDIVKKQSDVYIESKNILTILPHILSDNEMSQLKIYNPKIVQKIGSLTTATTNTEEKP